MMRKQGSLIVVLVVASVALFAACTPVPVPTTTTTTVAPVDCTARGPGVDLHGCDLVGADLTHADLTGANLTSADLTGAQLASVIWSYTTCPNGVRQSTECPRTSAG